MAARTQAIGGALTVGAFAWWGALPLYFHALKDVPGFQLLAHRALWAAVLLFVVVAVGRRWRVIWAALAQRRTRWMLAASTLLIGLNWFTFIYAVLNARVMEVSLGYYINPIVNVMLGVVLLRERLTPVQTGAVLLAAAGVANLAVRTAGLPWPAVVVALSFGVYGLIRKTTALTSLDGLFLETAFLAPLAAGYLVYAEASGAGVFLAAEVGRQAMLVVAGVMTAGPLLLFSSGARRIRYATVGFIQYLAPTAHFLLAVFVFGEPFDPTVQGATFVCIWTALVLVSVDSQRDRLMSRWRRRGGVSTAGDPR